MKKFLITTILYGWCSIMISQVSNPSNAPNLTTDYVGLNNLVTYPLRIRHLASDQRIEFFTGPLGGPRRMIIDASNATETHTSEPTPGFVGIGPGTNTFSRLTISHTPQSLVGGYRTWMKAGVFSYIWTDNMYVGLRMDAEDRSDAIVAWSDNADNLSRIDKLRFVFTGGPNGGTGTNPRSHESVNGYQYMVMSPMPAIFNSANSQIGHIGIGPLFNDATLPQNRLHIHAEDNMEVFTQISNELGTGQGVNDGLRLGYATTAANNLEAQLNQRENDRLSLYTNNGERMRIMHTGALNNGININPAGLANNLTRIGISHNPATPVNRPLSLLHLGYNMNGAGANTNGWRNWMDVGIYTTNGTDNVYLGLKAENGLLGDRQDAVLNWGDNQTTNGPDNFRFIFTSQTAGGGTAPATGVNGLEGMRLTPTTVTGVRVGIGGDPTSNTYVGGSVNPTQTLEVNSWGATNVAGGSSGLRFTNLNTTSPTIENPGEGVLSVNANGDVVYVVAGGGGVCEWDEDGQNLFMGVAGACHTGKAAIGILPTWTANTARLTIRETAGVTTNRGLLVEANSVSSAFNTGVYGVANGGDNRNRVFEGYATGSSSVNYGGDFYATALIGTAPQSRAVGSGGHATCALQDFNSVAIGAEGSATFARENYGVHGSATGANWSTRSIGVYGEVGGSGSNLWAMWANGPAYSTVGWTGSDENLKENINPIENATETLSAINPAHYHFRTDQYPQLNLPQGNHYGVISQQLEEVLPDLVKETTFPARYDSLGNIISEAVTFKAVNYNGLIPILIAGFKEQQTQIQSLQDQINGCCAAGGVSSDAPGMPLGAPDNQQSVTLTNTDKAMLGFASPNPNQGEVYVDYYIPTSEPGICEMLFTDATGRPVQTVRIGSKGNGRLNIDTSSLAAGQYQYTLIVDGNIIATRKIIRE